MKKVIIAAALSGLMVLGGCTANSSDDLFQYKNTKIGDNSKVNAIVNALPGHEQLEGIELLTDREPYEMKFFYETADGEFTDEMMIRNATAHFALVQNADVITFVIDGTPHSVRRAVLEDWYGQELKEVDSEEDLNELEELHPANSGEIEMIFED